MAASFRDRAVYYRSLSALLGAGAPASIALKAAGDAVKSASMRTACTDASHRAGAGVSVGDALAHHPEVFEPADVALLRAAEKMGNLDRTLLRLAEDVEAAGRVGRQLSAGFTYPIIVWHAAAFLPPIKHLMLTGFWAWMGRVLLILFPLYAILTVLWWMGTVHRGRVMRSRILARLPIIGRAVREAALARFLRVLGGGLDAGMSALEATNTAFSATTQAEIRRAGSTGLEVIAQGNPFSSFFACVPGLTNSELIILATAEKTGTLSESLRVLAAEREERAREAASAAARYYPLFVYLLLSAYVAWTIIGTYMGYLSILKSI
jgi:type II secretory pathway component PulF